MIVWKVVFITKCGIPKIGVSILHETQIISANTQWTPVTYGDPLEVWLENSCPALAITLVKEWTLRWLLCPMALALSMRSSWMTERSIILRKIVLYCCFASLMCRWRKYVWFWIREVVETERRTRLELWSGWLRYFVNMHGEWFLATVQGCWCFGVLPWYCQACYCFQRGVEALRLYFPDSLLWCFRL